LLRQGKAEDKSLCTEKKQRQKSRPQISEKGTVEKLFFTPSFEASSSYFRRLPEKNNKALTSTLLTRAQKKHKGIIMAEL